MQPIRAPAGLMDDKWFSWIFPVIYLILYIVFFLFLLKLVIWLVLYIIKRRYGVEITFTGVWFASVHQLRIQWDKGEVGVNDLSLSVQWCKSRTRRRWLHLSAGQIYCVARDDVDGQAVSGESPQQSNAGKFPKKAARPVVRRKRLRKVLFYLLRKSTKFVDITIGNILVDWPCSATPPLSITLSLQELSVAVTPTTNHQDGISAVCDVKKAIGRFVHDCTSPPFDAEDILRAVFCGQFVLQLSLSADRPIRLFQLTIVPVSIHVFEGMLELLASKHGNGQSDAKSKTDEMSTGNTTRDSTNNHRNDTTDDRNNTTSSGNSASDESPPLNYQRPFPSILPQKSEVLLEDCTVFYLANDERKLSVKMSRLLMSAHTSSDLLVCAEMSAHKLKLFTTDSDPAVSVGVVRHSSEVSNQHISNHTVVDSMRGLIKEQELVHWIKHFRTAITRGNPSMPPAVTPSSASRSWTIAGGAQSLMKRLPSSVSLTTTFEAVDWQMDCCLDNPTPNSKPHPFSRLMMASIVSTTHTSRVALRHSLRVKDAYIYTAVNHNTRGIKSWYDSDSPSILPSTHHHVWGRVVAMGTCFVEVLVESAIQDLCSNNHSRILPSPVRPSGDSPSTASPSGDSLSTGSPIEDPPSTDSPSGDSPSTGSPSMSPVSRDPPPRVPPPVVSVESELNCCSFEWSPITCHTVVNLLNYVHHKYGILATAPPVSTPPVGPSTLVRLEQALENITFKLSASNVNLFVVEPSNHVYFLLVLHSDLVRLYGSGGGRSTDLPSTLPSATPPGGSTHLCCSEHPQFELDLSSCLCSCEAFDQLQKSFPCSLMRDLPPGLIETPSLSVSMETSDTLPNVVVKGGDIAVNWTTSSHCTANHILRALLLDVNTVRNAAPLLNKVPHPSAGSKDTLTHPQPLPLSYYSTKLSKSCSLSVDVSKVTINTTVNKVFRFSGVAAGNRISFHNGHVECVSKEVEGVFDKNRIVCIADFTMQSLEDDDPLLGRTKFPSLSTKTNTSLELKASSLALVFPQGFKFSESFEKLMAIRKFLRKVHFVPGQSTLDSPSFLLPDLYMQVDLFSFQLQDEEFEAKLRQKQMLMSSDWSHKLEFVKALQLKIEEIEMQQGKRLTAKKKQELYDSLESQLYCDRAKVFYSEHTADHKLFEICFEGLKVDLLSDPSMVGRDSMLLQMKDIDPKSPHPPNLEFTTLWGWYMTGHSQLFKLLFRDFPHPLLSQSDVSLNGRTLFVEEESVERATRPITIQCDRPWNDVTVVKKMAALKLYHDWTWKCKVSVGSWGSCYEPVLAQVNLAFENIAKKSIDPSKPLPFWDKMRLAFHGPFKMSAQQAQLVLLASRDPYNTVEYLDCHFSQLQLLYDTGVLKLGGGVDVYVRTATKYDECQILHVPKAVFQANLKWVCRGPPNAHHNVMPCMPEKVPALSSGEIHDSFSEFRSQNLNLELNLELLPGHDKTSKTSKSPTLVIYASTLRWLQSFVSVLFRRVTRPVRKGRVFTNVRPKRSPFSRQLRDVDISFTCSSAVLCYWGSVVQQRGARAHVRSGELQLTYTLGLVPFSDGLIRRPTANWSITSCHGNGEDIRVFVCNGEDQRVQKAPDFYQHLKHDQNLFQHFFTMSRCSYLRLKQTLEETSAPDLQLTVDYQHQLQTSNTKVLWTNVTKEVIFGLYETYRNSQELKDNLMSDALKPSRYSDSSRHPSSGDADVEGSIPSSQGNSPNGTLRDGRHRSPGSNLLAQLVLDVNRHVEHSDEREGGRDPELRGKQACSTDDIAEQTWLIQLKNTQLAFQGMETGGCVLVSSSLTHMTSHKHHPQLNSSGEPVEKTAWIARVEGMQYFATIGTDVSLAEDDSIPWLSLSTVSGEPPESSPDDVSTSCSEIESEQDINNILISSLGPRSSSHVSLSPTPSTGSSFKDPLFSKGGVGRHGDAVGGLVLSTARGVEGEYVHLQRVASHCYCQIFYVQYSALEDQAYHVPVRSVPTDYVDTFTIRHPSVEISTTSSQYVMLLDIINNVLLHKEPSKREAIDRRNKLKFSLELSNIEDYRIPVLTRQEKARQLIQSIHQLERELFLALKSHDSFESVARLRTTIRDTKDQLKDTNQELSVLISLYKENQYPLSPSTSKSLSRKPHAVVCVEVWLDEAHWSTRDKDGQIELAHVHLINCKYNRLMFSDDSGEHCFELEALKVQDLSPNAMYTDVLFPLDKSVRVDKDIRLRVFSRDKAPVAGITVKEHFEVNVVPLAVQLTSHFYDSLFEFFFPSRGDDPSLSHSSEMAHMIVGAGARQGGEKKGEEHQEQDKKSKKKHSEANRKKMECVSDVDTMSERALEVKTFLYVKIPRVPLRISYHGRQGGIPIDIDNFNVSIPTLEYHSQNWTWKDMFMAVKKDCKQAIIPKAIKTKLGMESHTQTSNEDTSSINILGLAKNLQDTTRSSKRLFGRKSHVKDPPDKM